MNAFKKKRNNQTKGGKPIEESEKAKLKKKNYKREKLGCCFYFVTKK